MNVSVTLKELIICEEHSKALKRFSILVGNNCEPVNMMFQALIFLFSLKSTFTSQSIKEPWISEQDKQFCNG